MTDKQGDILIGLSVKMEKSLANIEKTLGGTTAKAGKATSVFASLSTAIGSLTSAVSAKAFSKKKANDILDFAENLVKIASGVKADEVKGFSDFADGISKALETILNVMSIGNLIKLALGAKILFTGKKPVLKTIIEGFAKMFADIDSSDLQKMKTGGEAIAALGTGLLALSKAMGKLILIGIAAPLVLLGALVVRAVVGLFTSLGKHASSLKKGAEAMKTLGKGMVWFAGGLAAMALVLMIIGPTKILGIIAVLALFSLTFALIGKVSWSISRGARALAKMGIAMWAFSAGLAMLMLAILISTPKMILIGIATLMAFTMVFWVIGKFAKNIAEGALVMILGMSLGLFFFSGALMILGLALKLYDWETLLMGVVIIGAMGLVFALLGKMQSSIDKGALAVAAMGVGLGFFAIGILLYGLALKAILALFSNDYLTAGLAAAGILLGLGLVFAGIGFLVGYIVAGAIAVIAMGAALIVFSLGIILYALAIKMVISMFKDDYLTAALAATGILLGLGLVFAGIGALAIPIILGSVAVLTMGAALVVFSLGIIIFGLAVKMLMSMFDDDLAQAGMIGATILGGMALIFSGIGLLIVPIVLGSVGVILMGAALIVFSVGLLIFGGAVALLKTIADGSLEAIPDVISGVVLGAAYAFTEAGLLIVPIVLGSVATILMGVALITLSVGLLPFAAAMVIFKNNDLLEQGEEGWDIKGMSALVSMAGHFKSIGKIAFSPWPWLGMAFSIGMGASLLLIGGGLYMAALAMEKIPSMDQFIEDFFAEGGFIPSMAEAFVEIGNKYGGSLLSSFLGTDPVSLGIRSIKGMGSALTDVAGGIAAFANFKEFPVQMPDPKDPSKLIYGTVDIFGKVMPGIKENLPGLLTVLADVFADIGDKYGGGFWSDGPVQAGMDAVDGMGSILSEMAGGIAAFANFEEFPVQIPDPKDPSKLIYKSVNLFEMIPKIQKVLVGDNSVASLISGDKGILFSLAGVFANIAQAYPDGFLTDSDVQKGVESVQGIGKEVSDLVGGIVKFANFEEFPVQVPDAADPSKLTYKTVNLFDVIPKIIKVLAGDRSFNFKTGKFDGSEGILLSLAGVFAKINERYPDGFFSDSDVAAGVESVKGIGGVISDLAGGIVAFADVEKGIPVYGEDGKITGYKPYDMVKIKNTIISVLNTIPDAFLLIDLTRITASQVKADAVAELMDPVTEIAKAITDMFVEKDETKVNLFDTLGTAIAKFATDISGVEVSDKQIKMLEDLVDPLEEFSKMGDGLSTFADALSKTGTAFATFASGFGTFSTSLAKFEKFETSMSSLITNQSKYNFDKFATSMGELKTNVNAFDVEKLKLTDSMMRSMAIITKAPETLADRISETLEESFQELVDAIKKIAEANEPEPTTTIPTIPGLPGLPGVGGTAASGMDAATLAVFKAFNDTLSKMPDEIGKKVVLHLPKSTTTSGGIKVGS